MLSGLATWIESVIEKIGYLGVALLVGLENVIPVIPSEIVQPYAGFVAQRDNKSVVLMIIVATIGSVLGSLVMYGIAAWMVQFAFEHSSCVTENLLELVSTNSLGQRSGSIATQWYRF